MAATASAHHSPSMSDAARLARLIAASRAATAVRMLSSLSAPLPSRRATTYLARASGGRTIDGRNEEDDARKRGLGVGLRRERPDRANDEVHGQEDQGHADDALGHPLDPRRPGRLRRPRRANRQISATDAIESMTASTPKPEQRQAAGDQARRYAASGSGDAVPDHAEDRQPQRAAKILVRGSSR